MKKLFLVLAGFACLIPSFVRADGYKDRDRLQPQTIFENGYAFQGFDCTPLTGAPKSAKTVGLLEAIVTNSLGSAVNAGIAMRLADSDWGWGIVDASATPDWDGTFDSGCQNATTDDCEFIHSGVANNDGALIASTSQFDAVCANMTSGTNGASTGVMAVKYYDGSAMQTITTLATRSDETDWATANGKVCTWWRAPNDQVTGCTAAVAAAGDCASKYVVELVWTTATDTVIKASQVKVGKLLKSQEALADNSSAELYFDPSDTVLPAGRCFMPVFGGASGTTGTNAANGIFLKFREME